jgi:hypothetical protein
VETGRTDGGRHYYFRYPPNITLPSKKIKGLEIKSDGSYVVAPFSIHHTGKPYVWKNVPAGSQMDDVPECFINLAIHGNKIFEHGAQPKGRHAVNGAWSGAAVQARGIYSPPAWSDTEEASVIAALKHIPADDRDTWLRIGMALHWTTWGDRARGIWDEWSKQSAKYDPAGQDKAWNSFGRADHIGPVISLGTLFELANCNGYDPHGQAGPRPKNPSQLQNVIEEMKTTQRCACLG